jgi:hypothetical protein
MRGKIAEALGIARKTAASRRRVLGDHHPNIIKSMELLQVLSKL